MLSERQQNHLFKRLGSIKTNNTCADCYVKGATWTSVDFGVFVCINCSGSHRSLGMHITRVRSTKLDNWSREDAKIMELVGNEIANSYYLGSKTKKFLDGSPLTFGNSDNRRTHIKKKYVDKIYCASDMLSPAEFIKENGFNLKKDDMRAKYLQQSSPMKNRVPNNKVMVNKKKPISLRGLKKSSQKKKNKAPSNNDLLNMDFGITPAKEAPADLWDFSSSQKTNPVPSSSKPQVGSDNNLLDFDFVSSSKPITKNTQDTNDLLNLGTNSNPSSFPKPPTRNAQMFNTNPTSSNNTFQNDKYNCLSFNQQPLNKNYFYSNQANANNTTWNAQPNYQNGMNNMNNMNRNNGQMNNWGMPNKPKNTIPDKYDVFDLCMNNNRNGYFN